MDREKTAAEVEAQLTKINDQRIFDELKRIRTRGIMLAIDEVTLKEEERENLRYAARRFLKRNKGKIEPVFEEKGQHGFYGYRVTDETEI